MGNNDVNNDKTVNIQCHLNQPSFKWFHQIINFQSCKYKTVMVTLVTNDGFGIYYEYLIWCTSKDWQTTMWWL